MTLQDYHLRLKEITLHQAIELMGEHQVFYNYETGKLVFPLDVDSLPTSILGKCKYYTIDSWLELDADLVMLSSNQKKLQRITETIWEAMDKLIELEGHSDLTLHLEGSCYDIQDMIEGNKEDE